ncbi:hypothetical protein CEO81_24685 [Klebsiella pneumoniae]|nr:hypothetical protein CEP03_24815 [Klebsiella pneumoniae]OZJ24422.1 hypothetical protein CEP02_19215 [Klebsiella pneumoniae]OZJ28602.1 hypothetical protein CEP01_24715 [Klebsiella pneumoniae]OZJ40716.1 hypothetical protein CEO99_18745 [Klebsiella pneumoniae]OZJ52112.1 hypothetical protein CEO97_18195 [Klebsiella pneumoniae]
MDSVHHIWCPLSSQEFQDLPDGAETTLTISWWRPIVNWTMPWQPAASSGERRLSPDGHLNAIKKAPRRELFNRL